MNKKWSLTVFGVAALALSVAASGFSIFRGAKAEEVNGANGDEISIGGETFEPLYYTGFENTTTSTSYQGTVTSTDAQTDGVPWEIYYGTFSTSSFISGSKSLHMRLYSDKKCGYAETTADVAEVKAFQFDYQVSNTAVRFDVKYSSDAGVNWYTVDSVVPSETTKQTYSYILPTTTAQFRLKVEVTGGFPSKSNYTFRIDDVYFGKAIAGTEDAPVATAVSIDQTEIDIDGKGKDFTTALTASVTMSDGSDSKGVTWTSSDDSVAVIDSEMGVLSPRGNGTATITATTKDRSESGEYLKDSIAVTVSNYVSAKGERANPYTVAEAIAAIDAANGTIVSGAYTFGVVSRVEKYFSNYNSLTYYISDDGSSTNELQVYSGKGLDSANFSSEDDLSVGQKLIICGNLKLYNGVYEYDKNNYIVEFVKNEAVSADIAVASEPAEYYNGTIKATSQLSTSDFLVKTYDDNKFVQDNLADGTGFLLNIYKNGTLLTSLDASSEAQTYSFSGAEASSETVKYTVTAEVNGLLTDPIAITVIEKNSVSAEWTTPQTSQYYAHKDSFSFDGVVLFSFNDASSVSAKNREEYVIRSYDGAAENYAGGITEIPTHSNGTINLSETTQYVLDVWAKGYEGGVHAYQVITVNVPTLTIEDNYLGDYFVGSTRALDVKVTAHFGDESRDLSESEYVLSQTSVTPVSVDPITVTANWVIDEETVLTSNELTITPVLSTRVLEGMIVDDFSFSAGSFFVLPSESILLSGTENGVAFDDYLEQGLLTFEDQDGNPLTSETRLTKKDAGTVVAHYSEGTGEGKEVTAIFEITITNAVVEEFSEKQILDTATKATSIAIGDVVYLVCEAKTQQFNGVTSKIGDCVAYSSSIDVDTYPLEVVSGHAEGTFAFKMKDGNYLSAINDNKLPTATSVDAAASWKVSFTDGGDADILNCSQTTRRIMFNNSSPRFCAYKQNMGASGYSNVQLYKRDIVAQVGDPVSYLKSVIDAYRLNNSTEENSICASSGIYSSSEWDKAKTTYSSLIESERNALNVEDYFGDGSTYVETYEMLIANDPANKAAAGFVGNHSSASLTALITVASSGVVAGAALLLLRKKKEN